MHRKFIRVTFYSVAGFLSWDKDDCHVDLEKELQALVTQAPEGEEARNGNFVTFTVSVVYNSFEQ